MLTVFTWRHNVISKPNKQKKGKSKNSMRYYRDLAASSRVREAGGLLFFPTEERGGVKIHSLRQKRLKMNLEKKSGDSFPIVFCSRYFPQSKFRNMVLRKTSKSG